jgi:SulP family sulfate permease
MKAFEFKPKLFLALKNYSKELFMADLMAGIIVGVVALPLANCSALAILLRIDWENRQTLRGYKV